MSTDVRRSTAAATASAVAVLLVAAPSPAAALRSASAPTTAAAPTDLLVAVLVLAAWALVAWLATTVALTLSARLPGLAGRAAALATRLVAPRAVRRAVEVALGLTLATGSLAAPASAATAGASHPVAGEATPPRLSATTDLQLDWVVLGPARGDHTPSGPPPQPDLPRLGGSEVVVVQPGDTLWGLAERSLRASDGAPPAAAEVARAWPAWWSANREVVGDDPHLLMPGMVLSPPGQAP